MAIDLTQTDRDPSSMPSAPPSGDVPQSGGADLVTQISDSDVLEQLSETNYNVKIVCTRLGIDKPRVLQTIANNYTYVAQQLRARRLIEMYDLMSEADVAIGAAWSAMRPEDIGRIHSQLSSSFQEMTRPAEKNPSGSGMNLNLFLGRLPGSVRSNVEGLVDMDEAEWEQIDTAAANAPLTLEGQFIPESEARVLAAGELSEPERVQIVPTMRTAGEQVEAAYEAGLLSGEAA